MTYVHGRSPVGSFIRDPDGALRAVLTHAEAWASVWWPVAGAISLLAVLSLVHVHIRLLRRRHERFAADARLVTILAPPIAHDADAAALWANLVGLLRPAWQRLLSGQPHLAWEYVFTRDGIRVQLWVPGVIPPGMVERAVEAAWPGSQTRTAPAGSGADRARSAECEAPLEVVAGELRLGRNEALPIRTDFAADPIRPLLGAPIGLGPHERAVVQVLARPVAGHRLAKARRAAHDVRANRTARSLGGLLDLVTLSPTTSSHRRPKAPPADKQSTLEASAQDRMIVTKQRGPQYEVRVRYIVTAALDKQAAEDDEVRAALNGRLRGRAHAIASAFATFTDHNRFRRVRLHRHPVAALAGRRLGRGDLLSVPELAAIAHLPWDASVPGLQRAGARAVPPPQGVPTRGTDIKPIGLSDSGHVRPVGLRVADARHHLHILGATGSGKSELMARMILDDAEAGRGVVVVDPKGDLVTDVMMRLPKQLGHRVVLFDADSRYRPPIINPLDGTDTARAVDNLVGIFSRVYSAAWGPRTDDICRAGLLTLCAMPGAPTLTDLPKLLTSAAFRENALAGVRDDVLRGFWSWYEQLSVPARAQVTAPLMNKLRGFLLRPFVRAAIAGGESTVDMDSVLDGGICLVRVARDALGTESSRLVGSIIVARTWQAATRRARLPQSQRRDSGLFIDEAHNFLNLPYSLSDMLAEARGYRLAMTLAHQYLGQLPKELAEGISTNARSKIFFSASPEDAHHLARHTQPRLTEHDLANLGAFQAAVRPVLHGAEAAAFTAVTQKLPPAIPGRAKEIRLAARVNARPRESAVRVAPARPDPRRHN
ncbi:type IV secretion system DNA-binding domain-containing protein [Embleya sp. NPDC055664]